MTNTAKSRTVDPTAEATAVAETAEIVEAAEIAEAPETAEIVARYLAVWKIPDPTARAEAVAALWTPDGIEYIEGTQYFGHPALTARVTEAHEAFVATGEYRTAGGEDATRHADLVTFTIRLDHTTGGPGDTAWSARVFLKLSADGRIREDYQLTVQPLVTP